MKFGAVIFFIFRVRRALKSDCTVNFSVILVCFMPKIAAYLRRIADFYIDLGTQIACMIK